MGQEYHSNNQPKLLADAFKGVSRSLGRDISRVPTLEATESSKTRKALLFDEPAMDVQDVAPIQVVEVRGEEQSREEHAEEKNAVEVEEAKVSEETLHSQALEANLMVEGVMLSDSELLLEDGEEGEEWEHGEIMDFAEEDVLNVENHEVGDQGDTSAQSIEEAQIEMEEFGGDVGTLFLTIEEMHHGHCVDWSAYICGSVSLVSYGLIGFAKGVLLVPTISGDADVADLSLALPIFRYVLLLNQMKVTGDSCGESAVDVPMHYEFKGFFDTQAHVVLIDVGRCWLMSWYDDNYSAFYGSKCFMRLNFG
ncbi:unnamed protein product [Brassica oleracea var. botrytis]|uniref:(rape) hypothetical protein n=1 Tax=Brassica napus TaxID=3708 RepID=A0A816QKQ5_BRANA|nr:unnamed protein product [Brassica napus]